MTEEQLKEEITKLENEARQTLANANFINGAMAAFNKVLAAKKEIKDDNANPSN